MNLFRTLVGATLLTLTGAGLNGCISAPDYPVVPAIDFKDVQVQHYPKVNGVTAHDTLTFAINFRDGDGDLGLSDEDIKNAPYNSTTGGPRNRGYSYNYIIQPYLKDPSTGQFTAFVNPRGFVGEYDGRFLRLDKATKPAPLKGELRYKLELILDQIVFKPGQELYFEISILDRGISGGIPHESNKIKTSVVKLGA